MREFLSIDREINAIRLRRSTFHGVFILVEGHTDKIFYGRFLDFESCSIVILSGKFRVLEVLSCLEGEDFQGVLAIVDADFDWISSLHHTSPNLIRTDTHDLETILLNSPALEKVLIELGSEEKIKKMNQDISSLILVAGLTIGYFRWISQMDELHLTFEGIRFDRFIDEKTLQLDEIKLIQEVKNKSQAPALSNEDLQNQFAQMKRDNHDPWQVCCGHDLVEILSLGLRKAIGSAKTSDVEPNRLESSLRLAYESIYFYRTKMYESLRLWEERNQKIFKTMFQKQ